MNRLEFDFLLDKKVKYDEDKFHNQSEARRREGGGILCGSSRSLKRKPEFVDSIDRQLIEKISQLQCANCNEPLIDDGSPQTGYCGHLFCSGCAGRLTANFQSYLDVVCKKILAKMTFDEIRVPKEPDDKTPDTYIINQLYVCQECDTTAGVPLRFSKFSTHYRLFIGNKMLENIYKELDGSGYYCSFSDVQRELHPRHNLLLCKDNTNSNPASSNVRYACVWHAQADHQHTRKLVGENEEGLVNKGRLISLDRSKRQVFGGLYHCAWCATLLKDDKDNDMPPWHLECGHLVGSRCLHYVREKTRTGNSGVYCLFCDYFYYIRNGDYDHELGSKWHLLCPSTELNKLLILLTNDVRKCKLRCQQLHPIDNIDADTEACKWCTVETNENKKK